MSNNYMNIGFRLELEPKYWSDVYISVHLTRFLKITDDKF